MAADKGHPETRQRFKESAINPPPPLPYPFAESSKETNQRFLSRDDRRDP